MARHAALTQEQRDAITDEVNKFLHRKDVTVSRLARDAGLAQSFVWNVANRAFKVETQRLRRLRQYIRMKSDTGGGGDEGLKSAIDRYLSAGGDLTLLKSSVDMLAGVFEAERGAKGRLDATPRQG